MTRNGVRIAGCIFSFIGFTAQAQVYPSTGTGWVLPGSWEAPLTTSRFDTANDVKRWEAQHADIVFGSMQNKAINQQLISMGYMYSQKLDCKPSKPSSWLSQHAQLAGLEFEDLFLHFAEDTQLEATSISQGLKYLLEGQAFHLILIRNGNYATARLPLNLQPNDELVVISSYPSNSLVIEADIAPRVEQAIALSSPSEGIAQWQAVHSDWQRVQGKWLGSLEVQHPWQSASARIEGRELNTGKQALSDGLQVWMLKLNWQAESKVEQVAFKPWLDYQDQRLVIPGWDAENDRNQDGFISDQEFYSRKNVKASARFRHQARLIPAGHMWPGTCWYRVNFGNKLLNDLHAKWYRYDWEQQGLSGAYNDDMAKLLGRNQFTVDTGGQLQELPLKAGNDESSLYYAKQMAAFLKLVKAQTQTHWLAANISDLNLWHYDGWPRELRDVVDVWLREHYLTPAMGLDRLYRYWDNFALAKLGDKSLIMVSVKSGRSQVAPLLPAAWHQDIETGLALYYLFNIPQQTYYHSWNAGFYYGSGNTDEKNWYRQGVPKNWVYQPSAMLEVDIGQPALVPKGYRVVYWRNKTKDIDIKAKTSTTMLGDTGVVPANWFWLYRSGWGSNFPRHGVIARQYSKGLVVYRAMNEPNNPAFMQTEPLRVSLPGDYRRVMPNGTLGEPMRYIELGGYEGAVLKKVE
ncbi:hypothetical protein L4D00_03105 [Photobacterium swingsii]|uniref:hypothetical protein n=1 Tax=Photobacterium swingsii TaxID=680026 RepID=UPI003550E4A5